MTGGWDFSELKAGNLPEKAASAYSAVMPQLLGANYMPIAYGGKQIVNGTNYLIICKQTLQTQNKLEHLVSVVINENLEGDYSIVSISVVV